MSHNDAQMLIDRYRKERDRLDEAINGWVQNKCYSNAEACYQRREQMDVCIELAEQILSAPQANSDVQPQLPQAPVSGSLPPKAEIESILRDAYDDTLSKWSSHLEVDAGISEYASQIIELFRRQ